MANYNLNKVVLGGRLTGDPELRTTPTGISVVSFTIAVNRPYRSRNNEDQSQPQADFISVTAWRQTAEFITRYFRKGSSICITGSIQTRSWTDNNNVRQYRTDVVADEVFFVDSKGENPNPAQQAPAGAQPYVPDNYGAPAYTNSANGDAPKFEEINDDDLPF